MPIFFFFTRGLHVNLHGFTSKNVQSTCKFTCQAGCGQPSSARFLRHKSHMEFLYGWLKWLFDLPFSRKGPGNSVFARGASHMKFLSECLVCADLTHHPITWQNNFFMIQYKKKTFLTSDIPSFRIIII